MHVRPEGYIQNRFWRSKGSLNKLGQPLSSTSRSFVIWNSKLASARCMQLIYGTAHYNVIVRCCHSDVFLGVKWDLKTHFQRPHSSTSGFNVPIWAAPLFERAKRPLEVVVWPKSSKNDPSKSLSRNTDHVTSSERLKKYIYSVLKRKISESP